jgi:hypothetical protein
LWSVIERKNLQTAALLAEAATFGNKEGTQEAQEAQLCILCLLCYVTPYRPAPVSVTD